MIKLSQNENPFGASPLALKAIADNCQSISRYPDIVHEALVNKLAQKYSSLPENIVLAAGSTDLVELIIKAFVGVDENIVTSDITFVAYELLARVHKRELRRAKLVDHTTSVGNVISLCNENTKVVFIANPNNPTGTILSHASMSEFLQTLAPNILVVLDEAYAEYVTDPAYPDSSELQRRFPNLIILRTFSKIYGLAGLRIGYAIAHSDITESLLSHRTPFSVNRLAAPAALAALDDTDFIEKCAAINEKERTFLYHELENIGLHTVASQGNFVFVELRTVEEKRQVYDALKNDGILARDLKPFGTEMGLRISVGRPEENQHLIERLKQLSLT